MILRSVAHNYHNIIQLLNAEKKSVSRLGNACSIQLSYEVTQRPLYFNWRSHALIIRQLCLHFPAISRDFPIRVRENSGFSNLVFHQFSSSKTKLFATKPGGSWTHEVLP